MRPDIAPGGTFPDYELPDHTSTPRRLSELQGDDPLILTLALGHYCPKEHQQHLELAAFYPKIVVAYTQIATISTDDHHTLQEFRASVGAQWSPLPQVRYWISVAFTLPPSRLSLNQWAPSGDWTMGRRATVLNQAKGRIVCRFHARDLHLVMGPVAQGTSVRFRVLIDGQPPGAAHGIDVDAQGYGSVTQQRLYQLIRQPKPIADREFEIEFLDPGVAVFAFTFG
jgi:hypothetical protein